MMKCAVADDENLFLDTLKGYFENFQKESGISFELSFFHNGKEIADSEEKFNLVFMDIDMPVMDGMSATKILREKDSQFILIFVTNLANLAIRGYEVNALDFVIKPLSYFEFSVKLRKAIENYNLKQSHFIRITSSEGTMYRLSGSMIKYVEIKGHHLSVHTNQGDIAVYGTLKKFEELLKNEKFLQINKYYLVNTERILSFDSASSTVYLDDGTGLLCSRSNKKKIAELMEQD